jgi:hypothetical protein
MKNSDYLYFFSAFASFLLSVYLWFSGQKDAGLFVAIWVPSILSAAVLIKLINNERLKK